MSKRSFQDEESNFWISTSDLMCSVLIVFILLFVFMLANYQDEIREYKSEIEEKNEILISLNSTRIKIIEKLVDEFKKANIDVNIDEKSGAIKLEESVLFDVNKSELKEEGKNYLYKIIPLYSKILIDDPSIKEEISQIIIEGHTDDTGEYLHNLKLSQERAFSVADYILSDKVVFNNKDEFKNYISTNGNSYSNPIINDNGVIDKDKSRRVEVKFTLKQEEELLEIEKYVRKNI